jgi:hypothetical protein
MNRFFLALAITALTSITFGVGAGSLCSLATHRVVAVGLVHNKVSTTTGSHFDPIDIVVYTMFVVGTDSRQVALDARAEARARCIKAFPNALCGNMWSWDIDVTPRDAGECAVIWRAKYQTKDGIVASSDSTIFSRRDFEADGHAWARRAAENPRVGSQWPGPKPGPIIEYQVKSNCGHGVPQS